MKNDDVEALRRKIARVSGELATTERSIESIERDIGKRESARIIGVTGLAVMVTLMLAGAASPVRQRYGASFSRVRAPFRVVDAKRKTVLFVKAEGDGSPRGVYLFGSNGKPAVSIRNEAQLGGGVIAALDQSAEKTYAIIGALNGGLGVKLKIKGETMVYAGGDDTGGVVRIYGPGDKPVAGITANAAGSGDVAVYGGPTSSVLAALAAGEFPHTGAAIANDVTGAEAFYAMGGPNGGAACVNRGNNAQCITLTVSFGR